MTEAIIKIEIERIVNLVAGFGWRKTEERNTDGRVQIVLEKEIPITQEGSGAQA